MAPFARLTVNTLRRLFKVPLNLACGFLVGVFLGVLATPVCAATLTPAVELRGTYHWTENISRASGAADFRDAAEYELGGTARYSRQLTSRLLARLDLDAAVWTSPEYEALERFEFGPRFTLTRKFGLGSEACVLAADVGITGRIGRLEEADAAGASTGLTLSKRFSPWLAAAASGNWTGQEARDSAFGVAHYAYEGRLILDPHPRIRFSAGAGRRDGTFTVGASGARFSRALAGALGPAVAEYYAAIPTVAADMFGPGWVSYRVEAEVEEWWCEVSPALTDRASLALRYGRAHFLNRVDVEYRQDTVALSFLYAF